MKPIRRNLRLSFCGIAGLSIMFACLNTTSEQNRPKEVLAGLAESVITPRFEALPDAAQQLNASVVAFCSVPTDEGLTQIRQQWRDLRAAWRQLEPFYFGPHSRIPTRYGRILDFWPVRESKIDELVDGDAEITDDFFANQGAVVRGIPAIEYLLFGSPSDLLSPPNTSERSCDIAKGMTDDVITVSSALRDQWLDRTDGFILALTEPETGEFMDERGALSELVNRMGFTIENIRVDRLGVPLGDKVGGQLLPDLVESRFSDNSLEDIRQVLITILAIYDGGNEGAALGLKDMPRLQSRPDIGDAFRTAIANANDAVNSIPSPLRTNLSETELVRAAYDRLGDVQRIIQGDIMNVLGLSLAFNDSDGD